MTPYKVIVVDDSAFMRKIVSDLIEKDPAFRVVDTAVNGKEAVDKILSQQPDIVTMDVEMPVMNGLEALTVIMQAHPLPVIMLSGINEAGMRETIKALEAGAFDFIRKPSVAHAQQIDDVRDALLEQMKAAMAAKERRALWKAEEEKRKNKPTAAAPVSTPVLPKLGRKRPLPDLAKETGARNGAAAQESAPDKEVVLQQPDKPKATKLSKPGAGKKHQDSPNSRTTRELTHQVLESAPSAQEAKTTKPSGTDAAKPSRTAEGRAATAYTQLVAVGCSTGGPRALKTLLEGIPADFPAPVVIVQHMPPNFTKSLAQRLNTFSPLTVVEAEQGMALEPGFAYIAPGGYHTKIVPDPSRGLMISLTEESPVGGHRPSVDVMFESLLELPSLKRHVVLMTGMGSDGAKMMKRLYDAGVTSTFAESEETCIVYGMPRSAVELGCVSHVLPLHNIAAGLVQAVGNGKQTY
ncbi:chemotaxis response regulator protein-glutamate methylesterase [Paenibacillus favisporus]|uniref:protein-glutamate methylesterase/protein-glutamine glutaminase n=1 Tax=Paenibacillus favisporus TaxID=221028 RepID=UPI002DB8633D|nr:chemotaxis response regulator protein-glutamate methylesterase [Paenibacillus favisporus]MEC0173284.1 chemotaxis response regulator protein-glutamate methylesterase [Paenibacillus favisporus]